MHITIGDLNELYLAVDGTPLATDSEFLREFEQRRRGLAHVIMREKGLRSRQLVYKLPSETGLGQQAFSALGRLAAWLRSKDIPVSVSKDGLKMGNMPKRRATPMPPPA